MTQTETSERLKHYSGFHVAELRCGQNKDANDPNYSKTLSRVSRWVEFSSMGTFPLCIFRAEYEYTIICQEIRVAFACPNLCFT